MTPTQFQAFLFVSLGLVGSLVSGASIVRHDEFQIKAINEALDPSGSYLLSWEVDLTEKKITFEAEVATLGYVGLGISPSGSMAGADIFIAGVYENGTAYGFDMHAEGMVKPSLDNQQDWTLINATENKEESKTYIKVSRLLNTCDDKDYPISNDTTRIIWSIGSNDDIIHHGRNRGTKSLNLLMPEDEDFNPEDYMNWDLENEIVMPTQDTTYWCSVKKAPVLDKTHHIIGFEPVLPDELAVNHTHHFLVYKCTAPEGMDADELFGEYLNHEGADCYLPEDEQPIKVLEYCMGQIIYVWSKGGKRTLFPEGVGYPFPDKIGENNYYVFEVHYDNPEVRDGLRFRTGGRIWYTDKEVQEKANLLVVSMYTGISITIPPDQNEYVVSGHCSSECTAAGLSATGDEGVKVFNSLLHSHLSGRKMKLRHFRGDVELPWIDFDNHYDFNFQQNKPLRDFVQILPGDQMTIECTYSTKWNNNKVVTGGLSTKEEMCEAFLWYYPTQEFEGCGSVYPVEAHFEELGVTNYTVSKPSGGGMPRYTIVEPTELAGDYVETLNTKFQWNDEFIREYERKRRYNVHETSCLSRYGGPIINVQFPADAIEYTPEDVCEGESEPTTPTTQPPGGGESTTTPPGGEESTTTPPGGGESTTAPPGGGESTTTPPGGGESTTTPPGDGESTTTPPGGGESTTTPPGGGESTTTPPGGGESTTTPPGGGESTATPPGGGESTTTPPGGGESTTAPPGGGESTTTPPGGGESTTTPPGDGESTTTPPGGGESTTTPPGGGESTTTPPGGGESTTTPPGGGESTATPPGGGESTTTPPGGGESTTTPPGGGESTTTPPGGGESTTTPPGGGESTTPNGSYKAFMSALTLLSCTLVAYFF